jgi:hypothetical protein
MTTQKFNYPKTITKKISHKINHISKPQKKHCNDLDITNSGNYQLCTAPGLFQLLAWSTYVHMHIEPVSLKATIEQGIGVGANRPFGFLGVQHPTHARFFVRMEKLGHRRLELDQIMIITHKIFACSILVNFMRKFRLRKHIPHKINFFFRLVASAFLPGVLFFNHRAGLGPERQSPNPNLFDLKFEVGIPWRDGPK